MSVQTSYASVGDLGYPGQLSDAVNGGRKISRAAEGVIEFGLVVSRGTDKDTQAIPGGSDPLGISIRDLTKEGVVDELNTGKYVDESNMSITRDGPIIVRTAAVVAAGAAVTYDDTDGTVSGAAVAGDIVALTGWKYNTSTTAVDSLVEIYKE